jgi:low affinity Fe/Cu permease
MENRRSVFDRFAETTARVVGEALFFTVAFGAVIVWVPTVAIFHSLDTWQLVLNTLTSVVAFLLIALLQNSVRRNDEALHRKLDTVAAALAAQLRHELSADADGLRRAVGELEAAVGLEERI